MPLGKRAMVPGKIVRSNEVLAHLGDDYYAWRTVPSAMEMIGRRKKGEPPLPPCGGEDGPPKPDD